MADIIDIAKRRGFFWQSSHIHTNLAGFYDYGHIGTLVKRKFENSWRKYFLGLNNNFYEIETSCIMPENVFKASAHLKHFVDPVVKCKKCGKMERADQILEESLKRNFEGLSADEIMQLIKKHGIKCPSCGGVFGMGEELNMMFPVDVGVGKDRKRAYLTPETAQGSYMNFKPEFESLRKRLPFGLAVVGKAFRNEISPRNALIRMREFTQAELQIFFDPEVVHTDFKSVANYKLVMSKSEVACRDMAKKLPKFYVYYMAKLQQFYLDVIKIPKSRFRFRELGKEKAFYNKFHFDVEIKLESLGGFKEVAGLHYRTDYDLSGHERVSGNSMKVNIDGKTFTPHVLEISVGVDRNIYALLELSLREDKERVWLKFPRVLSPFDATVFALVRKDGLPEKAKETQNMLESEGFSTFFDSSGSIGRMYRRADEIGQAACVTIDYDSLKKNDCTLRDRDSMEQIRVKIKDLPSVLKEFNSGKELSKLGKSLN